jgi:hypothetical protein
MAVDFLTAVIDAKDAPPAEESLAFCLRGIKRVELKQSVYGGADCARGLDRVFPGDILEVVQHVGDHRGVPHLFPLAPSLQ